MSKCDCSVVLQQFAGIFGKHPSVSMPRRARDGLERTVSDRTALRCHDVSLTKQEFKDDSNPNMIMKQYARAGISEKDMLRNFVPNWEEADFTHATDYQASLHRLMSAQAAFDSLPAQIRSRFSNDPALLLKFLSDSRNREEAIKLGLVNKPVQKGEPPVATTHAAKGGSPASVGVVAPTDTPSGKDGV